MVLIDTPKCEHLVLRSSAALFGLFLPVLLVFLDCPGLVAAVPLV